MFQKILVKLKKIKLEYKIADLVKTADLERTFSKGDSTIWSYDMYNFTEIVDDTIPSYEISQLHERYNEALLKKTQFTMKEN